ncbi:MAG TPA: hypothetical protein QGF02_00765 [Candidatus Babeliales bacterium]|nr:hypothetical protein [Candidatus Babeliales bacterium]
MNKYYFFANQHDNNLQGMKNLYSKIKNGTFPIKELNLILDIPFISPTRDSKKVLLENCETFLYEDSFAHPNWVTAPRKAWTSLINQLEALGHQPIINLTFDGKQFTLNDIVDDKKLKKIKLITFWIYHKVEDKYFTVASEANEDSLNTLEWVMRVSDLCDYSKEQFLKIDRVGDGASSGIHIDDLKQNIIVSVESCEACGADVNEDNEAIYPLDAFWNLWIKYKKEVLDKKENVSLYQIAWNGKEFNLYVEYKS